LITKLLANIILSACYENDKVPPALVALTFDERLRRDKVVFAAALTRVKEIINNDAGEVGKREYDGFPISARVVGPAAPREPFNNRPATDAFLKASSKARAEHKEVMQEFVGALDHTIRTRYGLEFRPCDEADCAHGCAARKDKPSAEFMRAQEHLQGHVGFFPSQRYEGKSTTYIEALQTKPVTDDINLGRDGRHTPSTQTRTRMETGQAHCQACPMYIYQSDADMDNHEKTFYPAERKVRLKEIRVARKAAKDAKRPASQKATKRSYNKRPHPCVYPACRMISRARLS
jgi:hypothetical protein